MTPPVPRLVGPGFGERTSWVEAGSPPTPRPGRMVIGLWAGHHGHVHDGVARAFGISQFQRNHRMHVKLSTGTIITASWQVLGANFFVLYGRLSILTFARRQKAISTFPVSSFSPFLSRESFFIFIFFPWR
jgi:hypothetical protein